MSSNGWNSLPPPLRSKGIFIQPSGHSAAACLATDTVSNVSTDNFMATTDRARSREHRVRSRDMTCCACKNINLPGVRRRLTRYSACTVAYGTGSGFAGGAHEVVPYDEGGPPPGVGGFSRAGPPAAVQESWFCSALRMELSAVPSPPHAWR